MLHEGVSARPTTISLAEIRESVSGQPMSAAGHSRRFDRVQLTSGPTPQADIIADRRHVSKVPQTDIACYLTNHGRLIGLNLFLLLKG